MLPKASIEHIVAKQRKALYDMPAGHPREISGSLPYLSDRPLLIGGMRGSGRAMLLGRMLKDEYPEAWYTDFDDPRLAGFDESDFAKLDRLIRGNVLDCGRVVKMMLDNNVTLYSIEKGAEAAHQAISLANAIEVAYQERGRM